MPRQAGRGSGGEGAGAKMATFSTVSMMREEPGVVRRFAEYYARLGAAEVLVYVDGPLGPLEGLAVPGLTLIAADAAFWDRQGIERPDVIGYRQWAIYAAGLARCRTDWLLVVDADEFVFGDRPVRDFLDAVPADVDSVGVPTAEAVWGPGDDIETAFGSTCFRVVWTSGRAWRGLKRLVYGDVAPFLRRGLLGHTEGKQFLRTGRRYSEIRNHDARRDGEVVTKRAAAVGLQGMYVGHFDAIGLARWKEKWRLRISAETVVGRINEARSGQMAAIEKAIAAGDGPTRALFAKYYGVTRLQYAMLAALGYGFRRRLFDDA